MKLLACLACFCALLGGMATLELRDGGIVRGPKDRKRLALEFTGHEFAEGGKTILQVLKKHHARASFFLTGDFLRNPEFDGLVRSLVRDGHYVGPHSDRHLLYCSWEAGKKTLVSRAEFRLDIESNLKELERFGLRRNSLRFWVPAFEWYNADIAQWSAAEGLQLINFTPGTRSNADYTGEADKNFVSSEAILKSILEREQSAPDGLNGFLLLMHIGAGPGRRDKMHGRLDALFNALAPRGYRFVRVDELLTR